MMKSCVQSHDFRTLLTQVWSSSVPDKLEVSFHVTRTPVKDCRDLSSAVREEWMHN